ncbi:MAG: response regulator [Rhodospirillales bacterium]|nr:response regulator [Rhodospirillales bacterium]
MVKIEFDKKRATKLIFFADDSSTVRKLVSNVLDQAGFEYDCFEDGEDLVAFMRKYADRVKPDVILLDVEMPLMNGFDACLSIKQLFPELKAPVLFFTASDTDDSEKQAREVGGDEFIVKPFSPDKLVNLLDHWVSKTTGWDTGQVAHVVSRQDKRVMIADDSRTVRKMVTMVLEKAGFTVDCLTSAPMEQLSGIA